MPSSVESANLRAVHRTVGLLNGRTPFLFRASSPETMVASGRALGRFSLAPTPPGQRLGGLQLLVSPDDLFALELEAGTLVEVRPPAVGRRGPPLSSHDAKRRVS